jgi:hypothetical protein
MPSRSTINLKMKKPILELHKIPIVDSPKTDTFLAVLPSVARKNPRRREFEI